MTHCIPLQDSIADLNLLESHQQPATEVSEESKVQTETTTPDEGDEGIACEAQTDRPGSCDHLPVVEAEAHESHEQSEAVGADGSESDEDVPMPENWGMQRQEMVTSQPESVGFATLPS